MHFWVCVCVCRGHVWCFSHTAGRRTHKAMVIQHIIALVTNEVLFVFLPHSLALHSHYFLSFTLHHLYTPSTNSYCDSFMLTQCVFIIHTPKQTLSCTVASQKATALDTQGMEAARTWLLGEAEEVVLQCFKFALLAVPEYNLYSSYVFSSAFCISAEIMGALKKLFLILITLSKLMQQLLIILSQFKSIMFNPVTMEVDLKDNSGAKWTFGLITHSQLFSDICFHDYRMERVLSLKTV